VERILFRFTKEELVRFVGHLDLMRVIERAMRRSGFPITYSQGFNPRPRMALASALTLGATSDCELCQLDLAEDVDEGRLAGAIESLRRQLPPGIRILDVWPIPLEKRNPYIQVQAAAYDLTLVGEDAAGRMRQFLEEGPGIPRAQECALETERDGPGHVVLRVKLPVGERDGVRIRDLVAELEGAVPGVRVDRLHRARLWCELEPAANDRANSGKYGEARMGQSGGAG
jgi:radical SAM-linked protein